MKIGDRVRIVKINWNDEVMNGDIDEYQGKIATITEKLGDNYGIDIDNGEWAWYEEELELVHEFDNDTYCNLICKYSDVSRELGKQKRDCELISKEIDRLRYEKESIEEEMHSMMKEFGERCERIGNE